MNLIRETNFSSSEDRHKSPRVQRHFIKCLVGSVFGLALLFLTGQVCAGTVDVWSLLDSTPAGGTVHLFPENTNQLNGQYNLAKNLTIDCNNGAIIESVEPIVVAGVDVTLTVTECVFQATGWSALAGNSGSQINIDNSQISNPGNTGVYASGSALLLQNTTINSSNFGIQMSNGATAILQAVTISNCPFALQVSDLLSSATISQGSNFSHSDNGTGTAVGVLNGATVDVNDSTVNNFNIGLNLVGAGTTGTLSGVTITNCPYGVQVSGTSSSVTIDQNSNFSYSDSGTGLGVSVLDNATITMSNSTLNGYRMGVNLADNGTTGTLHGVTVTNCPYAVQVVGSQSRVTIDQGSTLSYLGSGAGVGVIDGASATVHNSSLNGFSNGIDVQPFTPAGTAEIVDSTFSNNGVAAISVVDAKDVLVSGCRVEDAVTDGIYFHNSTGIIENSEVIGSLNTGVTFWGCSDGATIRNSLVQDSEHQGVGVVVNEDTGDPSTGIKILNNTLIDNKITNLLVDAHSTAKVQGNIFVQTPSFAEIVPSVRIHGAQGVSLESMLIYNSYRGLEIKDGSNPQVLLSIITGSDHGGILVYDNSSVTVDNSYFWENDQDGSDSAWSIFANTGANAIVHYSTFGPSGDNAFYNNAGTSSNTTQNYWAATDGPEIPPYLPGGGVGSGAFLDWNIDNSSSVQHSPFLVTSPAQHSIASNLSFSSGETLNWDSSIGMTVSLTAKSGINDLQGEMAGALRISQMGSLASILPEGTPLAGQFYVVWVSTPLRSNSDSGSLKFSLPSQNSSPSLHRRGPDGSWTRLSTGWDQTTHVMTYSPDDLHLLNGTFALMNTAATPAPAPWLMLLLDD